MDFAPYVYINPHYQNSININLDLDDVQKINSYIVTQVSEEYFSYFIDNLIQKDGMNATMLIAPYGRGKSHSLLNLLYLISHRDYKGIQPWIDKVGRLYPDLYTKIREIQPKKYLPVIISSTRGSLNQALFAAIERALKRNGIDSITIETEYQEALSRIQLWKESYNNTYQDFLAGLKKRKITKEDFIDALSSYDEAAYTVFKTIHKDILAGAEFVGKNELEVIDLYKEITQKLVVDYKFDGIYIVFDEFSKFLESRMEETVSNDMKIIQDLTELCNSTENHEICLNLVLHKPINDYLSMSPIVRNAFRGIEGRVTSYYLTTSLRTSFDIIANVLEKTEAFYKYKKEDGSLERLAEICSQIPAFLVDLDKDYIYKKMMDFIYPLNPITAYCLIKINEKVAQNERTLFTFLSRKSKYSLPTICEENYPYNLIEPFLVYDYFHQLLVEEKDNVSLKKITSRADSALNLVDKEVEKNIIKTLALILIVNEKELLPSNSSILYAALEEDNLIIQDTILNLITKGILVERYGGQLEFRVNMEINLNQQIENIVLAKFSKINLIKELNEFLDSRYIYPYIYNSNNKITRYYEQQYMDEKDFLLLDNGNYFFEDKKDGILLNIVRGEEKRVDQIQEKLQILDNERIVIAYPKKYHDYEGKLKKALAVKYLLEDKEFIEKNILFKEELEIYLHDLHTELYDLLYRDYSFEEGNIELLNTHNKGEIRNRTHRLSKYRVLGNIFEEVFSEFPIINLELINKDNVKGTYKTAREEVVNRILKGTIEVDKEKTSPVDTIINCVLSETGIIDDEADEKNQKIIQIIKDFFNQKNGNFSTLYEKLMLPPYGMRRGALPILIAFAISKLGYSILLDYKGKEEVLNAATLEEINDHPKDFSFTVDEMSHEKSLYLHGLANIFHVELTNSVKDYELLTNSIQNWFVGLPKITKDLIGKDALLSGNEYKVLKRNCLKMNINPSDFVLNTLRKLSKNDTDDLVQSITKIKVALDEYRVHYNNEIKKIINRTMEFPEDSDLRQSLLFWQKENEDNLERRILNSSQQRFVRLIDDVDKYSEKELIDYISFIFTNLFVNDWSKDTINFFEDQIENLKDIEKPMLADSNVNEISIRLGDETITKTFNDNLDETSELLENLIEQTIDDFGDVYTNEQKLALLTKIMKKYI